jgi:hypothetical protein
MRHYLLGSQFPQGVCHGNFDADKREKLMEGVTGKTGVLVLDHREDEEQRFPTGAFP